MPSLVDTIARVCGSRPCYHNIFVVPHLSSSNQPLVDPVAQDCGFRHVDYITP